MGEAKVSRVGFVPAGEGDVLNGHLGYVSFLLAGRVRVDGVTLRRTADGRLTLTFPARRDRHGGEHPYVRPIDDATRVAIERAVFEALGFLGVKP